MDRPECKYKDLENIQETNMNEVNSIRKEAVTNVNLPKKIKPKKAGDLGKNEFLKLLVAQLSHQDPLKPMEDKEFIAQMAQFSALEQMMEMNANMTKMHNTTDLNKAFFFLGKDVKILDPYTQKIITGKVQEIDLTDSTQPGLRVNNRVFKLNQVIGIIINEGNNLNSDKGTKN